MAERARAVNAIANKILQASVRSLGLSGTFVYTNGSLKSFAGVGGATLHVLALNISRGFNFEGAALSTRAELAIFQALARESRYQIGDIAIFTDSKAAILSAIACPNSFQTLEILFIQELARLQHLGFSSRWCPGE